MMMISIFVLLLLFGGGVAVIGLIVFAIASKKLWIIPAGAALLFLSLIAIGLFFVSFPTHSTVSVQMAPPSQVIHQMSGMAHTVVQGPPNFNAYVSGPNWSRILLFVLLIAFLFGMVARRGLSPAASHGLRRAGGAIAAILIVAFIFYFKLRSAYNVTETAMTEVAPEVAMAVAAQHQAVADIQQRVGDQVRMEQLAQSDIQKEIDQFDAPHIPISPDATSAEAPASPPKPPMAVTTNKDAKKSATATHKRKKSDKTPVSADTKQPQSLTQSKAKEEAPTKKKENTASSGKPAMVAEAEPEKPKPRPPWVDESPKRTGSFRREVIETEPYASVDECYQAADVYLMLKTYQRMQQLAGQPFTDGPLPSLTFQNGQISADGRIISYGSGNSSWADARLCALTNMGIGVDYIRREIVAKEPTDNESREYIETLQQSFGPMKKLYLQIEFTSAVDRELRQHWDARQRTERFAMVGVGAGSILGFLGIIFGLLKIDTWTKGYYTKRLFIVLPAAIITGCLLLAMLLTRHAMYR